MKPSRVAVFAALGMLLSSVSVYSLTPPPGASQGGISATNDAVFETNSQGGLLGAGAQTDLSRFTAGQTLMIEGRLGHSKIVKNAQGETFVMLEVRGNDASRAQVAPPVNLAIVMDRSGSMKGSRLVNAIQAATGAVSRMNDGDTVSVITFDTRVAVNVPPTVIGPGTRERVLADIRSITLGGDTCVSCGIEEGLAQLAQTSGKVNKMILLSDGDANHGVRDVPGFRTIAQRARDRGVPVTTIGVDVDYNEKIMAAIAQESTGRHYFVESDAALARIFESEAESATQAIANNAEASIDLAPGVELERVFDRSFRRSGSRVIVPLGTFTSGEVKTVLMKVRVPSRSEGEQPIADVELGFRDLVAGRDARCSGKLGLEVTSDSAAATSLDAVVAGRVQRSETSAALKSANDLFQQGRFGDARRKLEEREQGLRQAASEAKAKAPSARAADIDRDFEQQVAAVSRANADFNGGFATPPPGFQGQVPAAGAAPAPVAAAPAAPPPVESRAGKRAVKLNVEQAEAFGF
jgi:Ca-activated chloride channel family protein